MAGKQDKPALKLVEVSKTLDCYHCNVVVLENKDLKATARFIVKQERKNVTTGYLTLEQSAEKVSEFVNDTMF